MVRLSDGRSTATASSIVCTLKVDTRADALADSLGHGSSPRRSPMSGKTHSFNPFDAEQAQNAWPLLAELREEGPVASLEGGMHYVARHAACEAVLRDTSAFSNASGM